MPDYATRPLTPDDMPFLWEMLYQAVYVPAGQPPLPRDIVQRPEVARYVAGWGRAGDCGYLACAVATDRPVGAVWLRRWTAESHGYGYLDEATPELSIAVLPEARGRGVGTRLLTDLLASPCGATAISLSVTEGNPAQRLYQRFGFRIVQRDDSSLIMRRSAG
ncbi:MAG: GNAT family N-acetyltransferase [Anaerolineae bacterium]